MRYAHFAAFCAAVMAVPAFGQLSIPPVSSSYQLVNTTYVTRSQAYYTLQATVTNTGSALLSVTATATSVTPFATLVAGQGSLHFSPVPANAQATSTNTFTVLMTGGFQFDPSDITWSFNSPSANPGPNQVTPVFSVVTLNGGGSTNPSGIGSLTYHWSVQSAPMGSIAVVSSPNSVTATFTPDLVGSYVIALTVSNGSQSDTATATITTQDAPPTANPGPNQSAGAGATVTLDGTRSVALNGHALTYVWSFVSVPNGSSATIFGLRSPVASFIVDKPGSYIVGLVVNDGTLSSPLATAIITTGNTPPVAIAAASPQFPSVSTLVQLDGSHSTDADGNSLTYAWSLNTTQAPGSQAVLSNSNIVNPTFTADVAGTYIAQLIVSDGTTPSLPATVTVSAGSATAPSANAGGNQSVGPGVTVSLQGSGNDPQGLPLTYHWSLTTPPGSNASLSATNIANPTFVADMPGTFRAQLIVSDGILTSNPSIATITSSAILPVAVPTTNEASAPVASVVLLSAASSYDPNNLPITAYLWSLSVPSGSSATLTGATSEFARFVPDVAGTYVAQLIVKDQFSSSVPATASISAGTNTITITPSPLNLSIAPQPLTITLSPGAPPNPIMVTLSGNDPTVASLVSTTVTVPSNTSSVNVIVMPVSPGSTTITANVPGYQAATIPVTVSTPTMTVAFDGNATSVGLNQTVGGTITLSAPAPSPSGTTVILNDIQDHDAGQIPGLVTFNPQTVVFPPGSLAQRFSMTGATAGSIEIQPNATGYTRVHLIFFEVTP